LRGPLFGALCTLLAVNVSAMAAGMIWGPSMFTMMAYRADLYIGTALFTALMAYDTHVAI